MKKTTMKRVLEIVFAIGVALGGIMMTISSNELGWFALLLVSGIYLLSIK